MLFLESETSFRELAAQGALQLDPDFAEARKLMAYA